MKMKTIEKKNIKNLLKEAVVDWNVYAPQRYLGSDVLFDALPKSGAELDIALGKISLDDNDTIISAKDIFFPQLESLFEFNNGEIREMVECSPKLLFGVKPCDLSGILFVDDFYSRNFEDKYYLSRIKDRFVIVNGCIKSPRTTCFCTSTKTGPFSETGYDLQLVESTDLYFVEVGSKKGEEFVIKYAKFFEDAASDASKTILQIKSEAVKSIDLKVDFQKCLDMMGKDNFVPEENYKRISERCIYCGGCLYICPTCTCFNVFENVKDKTGARIRNWDACVFEGYTREASGHNPRQEKWKRTQRRYEHKLKYDCKVAGMSGCVGCGRCLSNCPVNIGISNFIQEITEEKKIM